MSTSPYTAIDRMFTGQVISLAAGTKKNIDARGVGFSVITPSGGTAKISRVDDHATTTTPTGAGRVITDQVADSFHQYSGSEWAYYLVEAVTQPCSIFCPPD